MWRNLQSRRSRRGEHRLLVRPTLEELENRCLLSITPVDVVGNLPPAEFNQYIAPQSYKDWGNEPSIAVNPLDPTQVVISSFAYGSGSSGNASLWYSADGGNNWDIEFSMPHSPFGAVPNDQTIAYDSLGNLHAAVLAGSNTAHGISTDPTDPSAWTWSLTRVNQNVPNNSDQPWLAIGTNNNVYVGYSNFVANGGNVHVSASSDNGDTWTPEQDLVVNDPNIIPTAVLTNFGTRIATDQTGAVYVIYGSADSSGPGGTAHVNYRLNRSRDGGATWDYTTATGSPGGLAIDDGFSLQRGASFAGINALRGNITHIAAQSDGSHVYAVYGKRGDPLDPNTDKIWIAEFHDNGLGDLVERPDPIPLSVPGERTALPSVAVTDDGTVFVMYDSYDGSLIHVHLATSSDLGLTFTDEDVYDFNPSGIPFGGDRLLGDYQEVIAQGNNVYGTFVARGNVNDPDTGVNTTGMAVPFFFSTTSSPDGSPGGRTFGGGLSPRQGAAFAAGNGLGGNTLLSAAPASGSHVFGPKGGFLDPGTDVFGIVAFQANGSEDRVEHPHPFPMSVLAQRIAQQSAPVPEDGTVFGQSDSYHGSYSHVPEATVMDLGLTFTDPDLYDFDPSGIPFGRRPRPTTKE